jgi:hypothetical protein
MSITAGATATALVLAAAAPSYADVNVGVGLNAGQGGVQVQGQLQIGSPPPPPPPPAEAPVYQGYPQQPYPQAYPQPYPPGYPPPGAYPPGYYQGYPYMQPRGPVRYEMRPRTGLIIAGSIMLGAAYLTTAGVTGYVNAVACNGTSSCSGVYWPLYVPLVGPFIYFGVGDRSASLYAGPALVLSGLAQIGGLAMIIAGAVARHRVPVYADGTRVSVSPYVLPTGGGGLAAIGRF